MWTWLFVGTLFGAAVFSTHVSQEDCYGKKLLLAKAGVTGDCIIRPHRKFQEVPDDDDKKDTDK